MKSEHTKGKPGKVLRMLTALAAVYGALQMIAALMMWKGKQMEEENRGRTHKRFLSFMNGCNRRLKGEKVEFIDLTSIMGGAELDLTGAELAEVTTIHICAVMSGVIIKVPPMVEVREDAKSVMSGIANMVPHYNREGIPEIRIDAECMMAGVSIKVVCPE